MIKSSANRISIVALIIVWIGIFNPQILHCQTNAVNQTQSLTLINENIHDATLSVEAGLYRIKTTGNDPFIYTDALQNSLSPENTVLSFEYFCPRGLDHLEIYFCPPVDVNHSKLVSKVGLSEGWVGFSIDLGKDIGDWGKHEMALGFWRWKQLRGTKPDTPLSKGRALDSCYKS